MDRTEITNELKGILRLKKIKEKTEGVNVLALETGDLLFLINSLEAEWDSNEAMVFGVQEL